MFSIIDINITKRINLNENNVYWTTKNAYNFSLKDKNTTKLRKILRNIFKMVFILVITFLICSIVSRRWIYEHASAIGNWQFMAIGGW